MIRIDLTVDERTWRCAIAPNASIDMVAHFERLLNDVDKTGTAGAQNAVWFRQTGLTALRDVVSFSSLQRLHIGQT
jgi:hypothetical protein